MSNEIKISKKTIKILLVILFSIILISSLYFYNSHNKKEKSIEEYKQAIYNSLLCQFSCPMKEAQVENQKQLVPDAFCIQNCTGKLKANNFTNNIYSEKELLKDSLFSDLDKSISQCKKENTGSDTNIDYTKYYACNLKELTMLKEKYNYLKTA